MSAISRLIAFVHGERRFPINRFRDGDNLNLPLWARDLLIGGFAEQGWSAYDQSQHGKQVATGAWGDSLILLPSGEITCTEYLARGIASEVSSVGGLK